MKRTICTLFCLMAITCSVDRTALLNPQRPSYTHSPNYKAVVGKQFSDTILSSLNKPFIAELISAPQHVILDGSIISWTPLISDTGIKSFTIAVKVEKGDDYADEIVEYFDTLNYTIMVFDSSKYFDCPGTFTEHPQYRHGGYKAVI